MKRTRIWTALILGTLFLCTFCAPTFGQDDPGALWTQAEDAYYSGDAAGSAKLLDDMLQQDIPRDKQVAALELMASAELVLDHPEKSRAAVEQLLEVAPGYRMDPETVHPDLMHVYFQVLEEKGELKAPDGIKTVAILDFGNRSITDHEAMEPMALGIADALITSLSGATDMMVVERERLQYVMEEIERAQSEGYDDAYAIRVGKLIGAQSLLLGGYSRIEDKIRIDCRLVETETGKILKTRSVDGDWDDLFDLLDELAEETAKDLGAVYKAEKQDDTGEVKALMHYSQGLDLMNAGDLNEAMDHFQAALELDPQYTKAENRLRQLQPLLTIQMLESEGGDGSK